MKIVIIILNFNGYKDTIKYVRQILRQKDVILDVVIVDNDSSDNSFYHLSREFSKSENIYIYQSSENGGYAKGNNIALRQYRFNGNELVVISNNDIIIDDEFLLSKWEAAHSKCKNVALTSPKMFINNYPSIHRAWKIPSYWDSFKASTSILESLLGDKKLYVFHCNTPIQEVECLPGSFFMISYDLFKDLGFFDEGTFLYAEETILARKIRDKGLKNYLLNDISYTHLVSKTISHHLSRARMRIYFIESLCYYHKKYDGVGPFKIFLLRFNISYRYFLNWFSS